MSSQRTRSMENHNTVRVMVSVGTPTSGPTYAGIIEFNVTGDPDLEAIAILLCDEIKRITSQKKSNVLIMAAMPRSVLSH